MQNAIRTTIRIRKDLFNQSKLLALQQGTSLQEVVNQILAQGFKTITDLDTHRLAMAQIDQVRQNLKHRQVNTRSLVAKNKRELQDRTDKILGKLM